MWCLGYVWSSNGSYADDRNQPCCHRDRKHTFSFLSDSKARITTHTGDGRLILERMSDEQFDILVLDALSSDAIPAHLLTREAFQLYKKRLRKQGVLAVHLSNNHLDLVPLFHRLSQDSKLKSKVIRSSADQTLGTHAATWALIMVQDHPLRNSETFRHAQEPKK